MLSSGKSIPPMTPRPPPGGMVLPNAFGLMSMKSFKRSSSSKGNASTQVRPKALLQPCAAMAPGHAL